jgi:tetratricopeptide (TPR) repeat protein
VATSLACGQNLTNSPDDVASRKSVLATAESELSRGHLENAENSLWSLLSAEPKNEKALLLLGTIRERQQRYPEAETLFRRVLELEPDSKGPQAIVAHKKLAGLSLIQGKQDAALEQYTQIQKLAPNDPEVALGLARLYTASGQFADALTSLESIPQNRLPVAGLPVKAACLLALGRDQEAIKLTIAARNSPAAEMDLAEIFLEAKLPDQSLKSLELAASGFKTVPAHYYYLRGRALQAKDERTAALASFQKAKEIDPSSADALLGISEIYAVQNKHTAAFEALQRANKIAPDSAAVLRGLVIQAVESGHHEAALAAAQDLMRMNSDVPEDWYLAGAAMLQERDPTDAATTLEKYTAARSGDAKGWLGLGMAYTQLQRYSDARKALETSVRFDPTLGEAEYQLGLVSRSEGKSLEAIQHTERAVQLQPANTKALVNLGTLYLETGKLESAQNVLEQAARMNPNDLETEYNLGLVLNKLGKTEEARAHMLRYQHLREAEPHRVSTQQRSQSQQP